LFVLVAGVAYTLVQLGLRLSSPDGRLGVARRWSTWRTARGRNGRGLAAFTDASRVDRGPPVHDMPPSTGMPAEATGPPQHRRPTPLNSAWPKRCSA
jgi:hypothetical protein